MRRPFRPLSRGGGPAAAIFLCVAGALFPAHAKDTLLEGWNAPPAEARIRAYWWWLNGRVTRAAITRDLEAMKAEGWGGALICDAGGAAQDGNAPVPHGPDFLSPEWMALFRHALSEASRLGLIMSVNIQSGWNLGGPPVAKEDAAKKLTWSALRLEGPRRFEGPLPQPLRREGFFREAFTVAYPVREGAAGAAGKERPAIRHWAEKAVYKALHSSAPDTTPLLTGRPGAPGEEDARSKEVVNLSGRLGEDGILRWDVPEGAWEVLRFGWTIADRAYVSTSSDGWKGYALDVFDAGAFQRYWDAVVEPLIAAAGPHAGAALRYLHTDSWEIEAANWTPAFREAFRERRGYGLLPYAPVLAGRIVDSREISNRFLYDFRRTLGDLVMDGHYRPFREGAWRHGLRIHPESGGPHAVPIDAQQCLGFNDVPMSEFWAWSWRHRVGDENRFFCKQPASAAHTRGRPLVAAEGFTTIGPHWQERIWNNLKPAFDKALCEGMNQLFWHAVVCSPAEEGLPGIQYFAGTHFNPNTTWWPKSAPFVAYLDRCQWMLRQGRFAADVLYYYGDHVPNFARLKSSDPAGILPGYDYDVISADTLLERLDTRDGRWVLQDGMTYRLLVLPDLPAIFPPVLRKIRSLVERGAALLGPKPERATGLTGFPESDREVQSLADALWGPGRPDSPGRRRVGEGTVFSNMSGREALCALGVPPDFEVLEASAPGSVDWIHRRMEGCDLYFIANRAETPKRIDLLLRVAGKAPEIWDPASGERRFASAYESRGSRTRVSLYLDPCGSLFVLFREPAEDHPPRGGDPVPRFAEAAVLKGPWEVAFDPAWGGPARILFDRLADWTERPEPGVRYYSGTAVYKKRFDLPPALGKSSRLWLDLGQVRELAEVRLNGHPLGVLWRPPFRVEITSAAAAKDNRLEVEVVNFWPNRIIGDRSLPPEKRLTRTNIRRLTRNTPLMKSGLIGPVRILAPAGNARLAPPRRRSVPSKGQKGEGRPHSRSSDDENSRAGRL